MNWNETKELKPTPLTLDSRKKSHFSILGYVFPLQSAMHIVTPNKYLGFTHTTRTMYTIKNEPRRRNQNQNCKLLLKIVADQFSPTWGTHFIELDFVVSKTVLQFSRGFHVIFINKIAIKCRQNIWLLCHCQTHTHTHRHIFRNEVSARQWCYWSLRFASAILRTFLTIYSEN